MGFVRATNATNVIGKRQWDSLTGNFYVAVPEIGGSDINAAPGVVLVIDAKNMNVQHVFAVDPSQCRGPQVNGDCSKSADTARLFRP
jgi:hypothetical protein